MTSAARPSPVVEAAGDDDEVLEVVSVPLSSLSAGEQDKLQSFLLRVLHKMDEEKTDSVARGGSQHDGSSSGSAPSQSSPPTS